MDKTAVFTLRELFEAVAAFHPTFTYKKLYARFRALKNRGDLPEDATTEAITWEQAKLILRMQSRVRIKPRKEAVAILKQQMRNDGMI